MRHRLRKKCCIRFWKKHNVPLPPAEKEDPSKAADLLWLSRFPLLRLPLELQLLIGTFTVDIEPAHISVHFHPQKAYEFRLWLPSILKNSVNFFAFAHSRHAYHVPIMQAFFQRHTFSVCDVYDLVNLVREPPVGILAPNASLGRRYASAITRLHLIQLGMQDQTRYLAEFAVHFGSLRFLSIGPHPGTQRKPYTLPDVSERVKTTFFVKFPMLESVKSVRTVTSGAGNSRKLAVEITEWRLREGARGRGPEDVVTIC